MSFYKNMQYVSLKNVYKFKYIDRFEYVDSFIRKLNEVQKAQFEYVLKCFVEDPYECIHFIDNINIYTVHHPDTDEEVIGFYYKCD
jgi:hypothetical protein